MKDEHRIIMQWSHESLPVDVMFQSMKNCRKFLSIILTAAAVLMVHAEPAPLTADDFSPSAVQTAVGPMPPTVLSAQPEGTPLPPRDSRVADHWPPEFKKMIDDMLNLFPEREPYPRVADVEKIMRLTLTERPISPDGRYFIDKRFAVTGTRYMAPDRQVDPSSDLRENYYIDRGRYSEGRRTQALTLVIAPTQSGFCLNPYELAVYTGSSFVNGDSTVHANVRMWAPASIWGMFNWSKTGRYASQKFRIVVDIQTNPVNREIVGVGCVQTLTVHGQYKD